MEQKYIVYSPKHTAQDIAYTSGVFDNEQSAIEHAKQKAALYMSTGRPYFVAKTVVQVAASLPPVEVTRL